MDEHPERHVVMPHVDAPLLAGLEQYSHVVHARIRRHNPIVR